MVHFLLPATAKLIPPRSVFWPLVAVALLMPNCLQNGAAAPGGSQPAASVGAPQDKPVDITTAQEAAMAPYIKQARDSFPAVRKRFLKGLGPGQELFVTVRVYDPGNKYEQVFARVLGWEGDAIKAVLNSDLGLVKTHHRGESLTLAEKDILDWTITSADGREEGNFVGKYLDAANGNQQPEPAAIPVGAWVILKDPPRATFLIYTYIDSVAGLSGKGGPISATPKKAELKEAVDSPPITFRLPMPGLTPAVVRAAQLKALGLPVKPTWMKFFEPRR